MDGSRDQGIARLMKLIRPRWNRERHERIFAAIVERIRQEEAPGGRLAAVPRSRLPLSHAAR